VVFCDGDLRFAFYRICDGKQLAGRFASCPAARLNRLALGAPLHPAHWRRPVTSPFREMKFSRRQFFGSSAAAVIVAGK